MTCTGHVALLHSGNRPRHVVHQQHRTGFCGSVPGWQHTHHHHPASAACGVQDWMHRFRTFNLDSEDRTGDGRTLHEAGCAPVKGPESCGRGKDAQSVPPKALSQRPHPIRYALRDSGFSAARQPCRPAPTWSDTPAKQRRHVTSASARRRVARVQQVATLRKTPRSSHASTSSKVDTNDQEGCQEAPAAQAWERLSAATAC